MRHGHLPLVKYLVGQRGADAATIPVGFAGEMFQHHAVERYLQAVRAASANTPPAAG